MRFALNTFFRVYVWFCRFVGQLLGKTYKRNTTDTHVGDMLSHGDLVFEKDSRINWRHAALNPAYIIIYNLNSSPNQQRGETVTLHKRRR
jgi:hypothetical protein